MYFLIDCSYFPILSTGFVKKLGYAEPIGSLPGIYYEQTNLKLVCYMTA